MVEFVLIVLYNFVMRQSGRTDTMKFEEKLIKLRKERGISQEELADNLSVSRQAVSRWELGTTLPDAPNLLALSDLFGVSIDYLLHDDFESDYDIPKVIEAKRESSHKSKVTGNLLLIGWICWLLSAVCNLVSGLLDIATDSERCYVYFGLMLTDIFLAIVFLVRYIKHIKQK